MGRIGRWENRNGENKEMGKGVMGEWDNGGMRKQEEWGMEKNGEKEKNGKMGRLKVRENGRILGLWCFLPFF